MAIDRLVVNEASEIVDLFAVRPTWLDERVQNVADLNKEDIPELDWIVPELIAEGVTVLAGMLKSGKSVFILNIGLAIAEGRLVLGQTEVKQGRVLYITPDDKRKARLKARIRDLREGRDEPIPFDIAREWPRLDDTGIAEIGEYLDYYPDTRLVIVDVLMNVLPDIREGADAYSEIYQKLEPLKELTQDRHVAIVLVMHMNKGNNTGNQRSRIYGSMAYGAIADNILLLDEKNNATHDRSLHLAGKDLEQDTIDLVFDKETKRYTYGESAVEKLKEKSVLDELGELVLAHPGITRRKARAMLGVTDGVINMRIQRAKEQGKICPDSDKDGLWPCHKEPEQVSDEYDDED